MGQLASFMRRLTNRLFRAMTPLWSTFYKENEEVLRIYRKLNQFLTDTFEEVLSHEETEGLYKEEELKALAGEKERVLDEICRNVYAALPDDWREQGKTKTSSTC